MDEGLCIVHEYITELDFDILPEDGPRMVLVDAI